MPAELTAIDQRLASFGLPANHPLRAPIPLLLGGYQQLSAGTTIQGGNALATLPDGSRAIVLSYTNAGQVTERGVEIGLGYQFTPELRGDVSFTGFDFDVDEAEQAAGDQLLPNTPSKKATFSLSYVGQQGFDGNVTLRLVDGYQWAAGIFSGLRARERVRQPERRVPGQQLFPDPRAPRRICSIRERFQMYGGSVIGRRVLGGVTANF